MADEDLFKLFCNEFHWCGIRLMYLNYLRDTRKKNVEVSYARKLKEEE